MVARDDSAQSQGLFVGLLTVPGEAAMEFIAESLAAFGEPMQTAYVGVQYADDFPAAGIECTDRGLMLELEKKVARGIGALDLVGQELFVPAGAKLILGRRAVNAPIGNSLPTAGVVDSDVDSSPTERVRSVVDENVAAMFDGKTLQDQPDRLKRGMVGLPEEIPRRRGTVQEKSQLPELPPGLTFTIKGSKVLAQYAWAIRRPLLEN